MSNGSFAAFPTVRAASSSAPGAGRLPAVSPGSPTAGNEADGVDDDGGHDFAQAGKGAHDFDVHLNRARAVQHGGKHRHALFGERKDVPGMFLGRTYHDL